MEVNLKINFLKIFLEQNEILNNFFLLEHPNNFFLQELACNVIHKMNVAKHFLVEVTNNVCYIHNIIYIRHVLNKTPYEWWNEIKPNISHFHQFVCI